MAVSLFPRLRNFLTGKRISPTSPPPYLLEIRSSKFFILSTVCIAVFTDIFLYGIIVPVIPFALSDRAGVNTGDVQHWVSILLAAYGGAMLIGSPIAGWYADRSSNRRGPLLIGLLALAGATLLLCLARSVALLVLGRVLQGLSAAVVWTVGLSLMVDTVGTAEIGEMMGYVSFSMSIGFMISPLIGGVVYEKAGYYPVFYICFGLIVLDIFLRLVLIEKKVKLQWVDKPAIDLDTSTDGPGKNGAPVTTSDTDDIAVTSPHSLKVSKSGALISLLSSRRLLTALWGIMIQALLTTAFDTTLPLFVQTVFHWNSIGAGLIFLCLIVPSFFAPLVGMVSDRWGPRWLVAVGFLWSIPLWVLLRLVDHDTIGQKVLLCALLVLIGFTMIMVMGPLIAEISYVVEAKEKKTPGIYGKNGAYAQAYGLFTMAYSAGTLIGPFWSGYIEVAAGWGTMTWTLALLGAVGAIPSLIWTGGLISRKNAKNSQERAVGAISKVNGDLEESLEENI